jgi:hypothetical protein
MSEETTQDTGSQGVATAAPAAAPVGFLDSLPEDLRVEPSLRNFTDPASLAKSYVHAQRMIGADKIPLPGKSATDEDWANVWSRLGRPQAPSEYELKFENPVFGDNELESFKKSAFEAGLNNRQVERMAKFLDEAVSGARSSRSEMTEKAVYESEQELRQEFGQAFEQRMALAYNAATQPAWRCVFAGGGRAVRWAHVGRPSTGRSACLQSWLSRSARTSCSAKPVS